MAVRIERLGAHHLRRAFDCGNADLNQFLSQQAGQLARKNSCKTYVAVAHDGVAVLGFVSVSVGQVQTDEFPAQPKLPRYPVPILRIGRLGVDRTQQGQGIGRQLIAFALRLALEFSQQTGLYAVVVDAKHEKARAFYATLGFTATLDDPLCLYLPVATVQKALSF
jgi:GNAT superfamily N-acetyltransferase